MKLSERQQIFTKNVAKLIAYANKIGVDLTFGHVWRSDDEQRRMVATGKSKTFDSQHRKRLAVDFNFFIDGELIYRPFSWGRDRNGKKIKVPNKIAKLGKFWEKLHEDNRWGGNFKNFEDTPHFEMKG